MTKNKKGLKAHSKTNTLPHTARTRRCERSQRIERRLLILPFPRSSMDEALTNHLSGNSFLSFRNPPFLFLELSDVSSFLKLINSLEEVVYLPKIIMKNLSSFCANLE